MTGIAVLLFSPLFSQNPDTTAHLKISGYVEAFYSYDFNQPTSNNRPDFLFSHNRHNEVNVNLGFIKVGYEAQRVRGNIAIMAGTYTNANLAAEPATLRNILEANAGLKLSKTKNLWLDMGVFSAHLGFESAITKDCWTLTRSLLAENSPYYETGAKLTYTSENNKWMLSGLVLNGWQQIRRSNGSTRLALGTQITFRPNEHIMLNSSTFLGGTPDDTNRNRFFHDLYGIFQLTKKLGLIAGFDIGLNQRQTDSAVYDSWMSPIIILRQQFNDKFALSGRWEKYIDKNGAVIPISNPNGFRTDGYSLNFDYAPVANALWRIEVRSFNSKEAIFEKKGQMTRSNVALTTSLAISF